MKNLLRELLETWQPVEIAGLAVRRKRVLGVLVSLTFDADPLIAWRAVEAIGWAADRIADKNPLFVRSHLRRLHWLLSEESGGVCWYAPQAMAEIVRRRPDLFADYADITVSLLHTMADEDLGHFRAAVLWAIGRLADVAGEVVAKELPNVVACLESPDPQVRGLAVWCLARVGRRDLFDGRAPLLSDDSHVDLYDCSQLEQTTVGALAGQ
jgi:hypothetical protein